MSTAKYKRPVYRGGTQPMHALPEFADATAALAAGLRIGDEWVVSTTGVVMQIVESQWPTTTTTTTTTTT